MSKPKSLEVLIDQFIKEKDRHQGEIPEEYLIWLNGVEDLFIELKGVLRTKGKRQVKYNHTKSKLSIAPCGDAQGLFDSLYITKDIQVSLCVTQNFIRDTRIFCGFFLEQLLFLFSNDWYEKKGVLDIMKNLLEEMARRLTLVKLILDNKNVREEK